MAWNTTLRVFVVAVELAEGIAVVASVTDGSLRLHVPRELAGPLFVCVGQDVEMTMLRDHDAPTGNVLAFDRLDGGDAVAAWDAWFRAYVREWDGRGSLESDDP